MSANMAQQHSSELEEYPLRPAELVMDIKRLGSLHQSRLSFMRSLMRKMMAEQWSIQPSLIELDEHGYGTVIYELQANDNTYSYVLFSNYLADEDRNDRVIADKWDVTMALCIGQVSHTQLESLRINLPKQEGGRVDANVMVLSRGNKSSRNFDYVVKELASGRQPSTKQLAKVGYLYRTTAVYGSGKFGMADWQKVKQQCPEFASPFAAEMFNCYMLRHFSIEQAEHLARIKSAQSAVAMSPTVKRFFGIGNSTGLGMAPYLIRHPLLISRWILLREKTLARVIYTGQVGEMHLHKLLMVLTKINQHFAQTSVPDQIQIERNALLQEEVFGLLQWLNSSDYVNQHSNWAALIAHAESSTSLETQEVLNSALMEIYPELVNQSEQYPCVDEEYKLQPEMKLSDLRKLIETQYAWALNVDFSTRKANHYFWYRSEDKMEPRIGDRFSEPGADKEMPLIIARLVRDCYDCLVSYLEKNSQQDLSAQSVTYFLIRHPEQRSILKRVQTMANECYGEIRGNLADEEMLPLDLLRCKLSFFGVSKFDPKSKLWVRNTMFQGAPLVSDIGTQFDDDWCFPIAESRADQAE